jgi:hypothetical protein
MEEQYVVPELRLVGETSEVVLGGLGGGGDINGEFDCHCPEFETDES